MKQQSGRAVTEANNLEVKTQEDYEKATAVLGKIKTAQKLIKANRDTVLKPILEAEKAERARWKPIEQEIEQAEVIVKQKMLGYVNRIEQEAREKERKVQIQIKTGKIRPETALKKLENVQQAPKTVSADTGSAQVKKVRTVKIIQSDLIPDQYWTLNEVLIRKDALAGVQIPGVEVVEENSIAGMSR